MAIFGIDRCQMSFVIFCKDLLEVACDWVRANKATTRRNGVVCQVVSAPNQRSAESGGYGMLWINDDQCL
jgi:hypothetical protein